ncbi:MULTISPECIES: ROK family transcriptional regulator [Kribbella]|uniref:NBD/HSP70 family sugar kinase n=1 Tax=Kribbella pratensis TaxID=2512112 RepID=A0ABY2F620_9ACTN|nr:MULTISPECIES: ROK family transcriptional regulator [Kribbella]TDW83816.1 putative NBD/HSP70 family sugar kinase [Kribbella pratensis]TDW92356.1 putative NBD/HSP70 family sugar kinase [Kribbella sp. VKM Ac-2566]
MTVIAGGAAGGAAAARPQLIREINEQVLLDHIRRSGPISRTELAGLTGLSKPTVSAALSSLERTGLVHVTGQRTGVPGPAASLYEVRPEAGFVLGLDVGREYLRGGIADLAGTVRSRLSVRTKAGDAMARIQELVDLTGTLAAEAGIEVTQLTQTVLGSPGVYDPRLDALTLTGRLSGWDSPATLAALRERFGPTLMIENDVDAAAIAERAHGHGRDVDSFAFVSVGTGIGMGLVLDGKLRHGSHGVAGEIGYLPFTEGSGSDPRDARKRGGFDASASAAAVVRAARRAGVRGASTAEKVFAAAVRGDPLAAAVVAEEALLVAKAVCTVITVVDPDLVVLGGGIGQAPGFLEAVTKQLRQLAPVMPEVKASVLGTETVVAGCLAAGLDRAWQTLAGNSAG